MSVLAGIGGSYRLMSTWNLEECGTNSTSRQVLSGRGNADPDLIVVVPRYAGNFLSKSEGRERHDILLAVYKQPGEGAVSGGASGISTRVTGGQVELGDEARAPLVKGQRLQFLRQFGNIVLCREDSNGDPYSTTVQASEGRAGMHSSSSTERVMGGRAVCRGERRPVLEAAHN
ncbi:hypothetical protein E2C01_043017 [Portunus trituberculatus]|uniref:Uncharacterized protein n=1 Tax=Portunus trituberculatus TaxID=210409 RepID=A0A5B7FP43_PORTR|nr:hypothetical protein [Portunus trituberculatus]